MQFQLGDGLWRFQGRTYLLRLTLGGLAELSSRLSLSGPDALASTLRSMSPETGRVLLEVLLRPALPLEDAGPSAAALQNADIVTALPIICEVFEYAFSHERK